MVPCTRDPLCDLFFLTHFSWREGLNGSRRLANDELVWAAMGRDGRLLAVMRESKIENLKKELEDSMMSKIVWDYWLCMELPTVISSLRGHSSIYCTHVL